MTESSPISSSSSQKKGSFLLNFLAGGVSGIAAKTVSAPVDRIKLILQTQHINSSISQRYTSPINCVLRVYREEGILSFWRGNLANLYRYFPNQAMVFAFKDKYKSFFHSFTQQNSSSYSLQLWIANLLSGGSAGATALLVSYPFDVARTRLATDIGNKEQSRKFVGTFDCLSRSFQKDGIKGLYSGFGVSLIGVVLFKAMYLGGYDSLKHSLDLEKAHVTTKLLVAQMVTTVVGTICYPIDTIKRRLMIQRSQSNEVKYRNGLHALKTILREESFRGLFSGLSVNLVRGFSGSILLVGYDELKILFHQYL